MATHTFDFAIRFCFEHEEQIAWLGLLGEVEQGEPDTRRRRGIDPQVFIHGIDVEQIVDQDGDFVLPSAAEQAAVRELFWSRYRDDLGFQETVDEACKRGAGL